LGVNPVRRSSPKRSRKKRTKENEIGHPSPGGNAGSLSPAPTQGLAPQHLAPAAGEASQQSTHTNNDIGSSNDRLTELQNEASVVAEVGKVEEQTAKEPVEEAEKRQEKQEEQQEEEEEAVMEQELARQVEVTQKQVVGHFAQVTIKEEFRTQYLWYEEAKRSKGPMHLVENPCVKIENGKAEAFAEVQQYKLEIQGSYKLKETVPGKHLQFVHDGNFPAEVSCLLQHHSTWRIPQAVAEGSSADGSREAAAHQEPVESAGDGALGRDKCACRLLCTGQDQGGVCGEVRVVRHRKAIDARRGPVRAAGH
jgi:hypothetical protein